MLVASTSCDKVDVNSPEHRAAEFEALRALLDSEYNQIPVSVASGTRELLLTDHFATVDTQTLRATKGWLVGTSVAPVQQGDAFAKHLASPAASNCGGKLSACDA